MMRFLPDVDPRTPEVISWCVNWEPTRFGGYGSSPAWAEYKPDGLSVTASNPFGSLAPNSLYAMWNSTTDTGRLFIGYQSKIYEISHDGATPVFADVTRTASNYNDTIIPPTNKNDSDLLSQRTWDFTNLGNVTIAVNRVNTPQYSISSGVFADLANAPPARCCESAQQGFLMLGNVGDYGSICGEDNMIAWSALGDYTDFVPSNATEAGYQQLTDTPGGITAIRKLGEYVVVYKRRAIYLGQYVGTPYFWSWNLVSDKIGCIGPQQVVDIGLKHVFVGEENEIFTFDGTRPVSISDGLRDTLMVAAASNFSGYSPKVGHNAVEGLVIFYNVGLLDADGLPNGHLVWDYRGNRWGHLGLQDLPDLVPCKTQVDSLAWNTNYSTRYRFLTSLVVSRDDGKLYNRRSVDSTTWAAAEFLTGVIGDATKTVDVRRITPIWYTDYFGGNWSASMTVTPYSDMYSLPGFNSTAGTAVAVDSNNRVDLLTSAHWHRFHVELASATRTATGGSSESGRPVLLDLIYDLGEKGKD